MCVVVEVGTACFIVAVCLQSWRSLWNGMMKR